MRSVRAPQAFSPGYRNKSAEEQQASNGTKPDKSTESDTKEQESRARETAREQLEHEREDIKKERNKQLVKDLKLAVGDAAYGTLRESGGEYRNGSITAREYYNTLFSCLRHYPQLLEQLIALLPDERKRVALERVHGEYTLWESTYPSLEPGSKPKPTSKGKGKERSTKPQVAWDIPKKTSTPSYRCQLCGDMIPGNDRDKHDYFHMHGSPFTSLSGSPPTSSSLSTATTKPSNNSNSTSSSNSSGTSSKLTRDPAPTTTSTSTPTLAESYPPANPIFENNTSFPSLSATTSSLASLSMSAWGRGKGSALQSQDFPTLSSASTHSTEYMPQQDDYEEYDPPPPKKGSKKSKKKNQVLIHFG